MKKRSWQIEPQQPPRTLQEYLADHLGISRNQAKALIDRRGVFINKRRVWMARHRVKPGDVIELTESAPVPDKLPPILHRESGLLILDKPPGVTTNGPHSLETILRQLLNRPRLEALHRLDRDTSGCVMFCDDRDLAATIIALFAARRVTKIYQAIVIGRPEFEQREMDTPLDGQPARTRLRVLDRSRLAAHLQISIDTGRTHQIRRHLMQLRLPLLGDRHYTAGRTLDKAQMHVPRQMLHARRLLLPHPAGHATLKVQAPLPQDFLSALRAMGLR
ncbi:MAG: pseudouridine synthase [Kiritimatiellia bacterium]|nr:RluA family pseudouridine synthase [Lentisphaerota bacterium]